MRLPEICTIQIGYTPRGRLETMADGGVPSIQLRDVSTDLFVDFAHLALLNLQNVSSRYFVQPGDVVFRSRGERNTASVIGSNFTKQALAILPLIILRPLKNIILPEFLAWSINQKPAQRHFDMAARGTNIRMIPKASLNTLEIDVPDRAAQQAIIEVDKLAWKERELALGAAGKRQEMISMILVDRANELSSQRGTKGNAK